MCSLGIFLNLCFTPWVKTNTNNFCFSYIDLLGAIENKDMFFFGKGKNFRGFGVHALALNGDGDFALFFKLCDFTFTFSN